jgi:hypothetical protein
MTGDPTLRTMWPGYTIERHPHTPYTIEVLRDRLFLPPF